MSVTQRQRALSDVPGWFTWTDQLLFEWLLTWQTQRGQRGDLLELGAYQGKSTIHMGRFRADDETLTVCDLFDDAAGEASLRPGARERYRSLSQAQFEANYLDFHDELPSIVRGLSSSIRDHVAASTCRFVHIDASHKYEHVREDTSATRELMLPGAVVVFDDYRTEHTIGTAAAVWEAIVADDLHPICASSMKLYATWGDPEPARREIYERLSERTDHRADTHELMRDERIIRVARTLKKKGAAKKANPTRPRPPVPTRTGPARTVRRKMTRWLRRRVDRRTEA